MLMPTLSLSIVLRQLCIDGARRVLQRGFISGFVRSWSIKMVISRPGKVLKKIIINIPLKEYALPYSTKLN